MRVEVIEEGENQIIEVAILDAEEDIKGNLGMTISEVDIEAEAEEIS